jgi:uncharacterized protein
MATKFLVDGPARAECTILLAHGAGGPMDTPTMTAAAKALAEVGFRVAAIDALKAKGPLIIGGKSMGGRIASMIADDLHAAGRIAGLLCLGYPFHPPGRPEQLRTAHLVKLKTPALIVQGTRDPFGSRAEVSTYALSKTIKILWLEDGDHDLKPRKSISGFSAADHLETAARAAAAWAGRIAA